MDISKGYLKRSLIVIIVFMALITAFVDVVIYFGLDKLFAVITEGTNSGLITQARHFES